jgi:hypothetical protein
MSNDEVVEVLKRMVLELALAFAGGAMLTYVVPASTWRGGMAGIGVLFIVWACK